MLNQACLVLEPWGLWCNTNRATAQRLQPDLPMRGKGPLPVRTLPCLAWNGTSPEAVSRHFEREKIDLALERKEKLDFHCTGMP